MYIEPTLKQTSELQNIVDGVGGRLADSELAPTPALSQSTRFVDLLEEVLPNKYLLERHKHTIDNDNASVVVKALDLAYKVKGLYAPEKKLTVHVNVDATTNPLLEEFEEKLRESLQA